jgi:hypothetical protein
MKRLDKLNIYKYMETRRTRSGGNFTTEDVKEGKII